MKHYRKGETRKREENQKKKIITEILTDARDLRERLVRPQEELYVVFKCKNIQKYMKSLNGHKLFNFGMKQNIDVNMVKLALMRNMKKSDSKLNRTFI